MLTPRENYLAVINHEAADYVPNIATDAAMVGGALETFENGPLGGGYDDFGLKWLCTASANGQAVPDPECHPVPDILEWKKYLKFPDLDKYDWEGMASAQLNGVDRSQKVVIYGTWNSIFLRFSHMLGFEDALCAMYEEPEACYDMMSAITDYKCRLVDYIYKYFKPDIITNYDDVCTERGPFMSPETYRKLIKPMHKRFNDAVKSYGILPSQHCCGKCEELIPDFIDEGAVCWEAAQPTNDIEKILDTYGDRFVVVGGYDTNGTPGQENATDDIIKAEVKRMMDAYASKGSFIPMGFLLSSDPDPMAFVKNMLRIAGYVEELKNNYNYKK
ncbi:MAG: hypothetical protein HFI89_05935 [Lachnospiraceae bacterium]|nr:hypothetical protein [Lachnospiraceae bacterium]